MNIHKLLTKVLLPTVGLSLLGQSAQAAAPLTYAPGDLLLSFQARSGTGSTLNYVVNVGSYAQFLDPDTQTTVVNLGNVGADLAQVYGANWRSRADLYWSVVGTSAAAGDPAVLYATRERVSPTTPATAWLGRAQSGQSGTANFIRTFGYEYKNIGGTAGGIQASGSPKGVIQNASGQSSYASFTIPAKPANEGDFEAWNTIQGLPASVLDVFEIEPVFNQAATRLGYFYLHTSGALIFVGANVTTPDDPYFPETDAPVVTLAASPKSGAKFTTASVTFTGTVVETGSGLDSVTYSINGGTPVNITPSGSSPFALEANITLVPGPNTILFTAVDVDGNIGTASRQVFYNVPLNTPSNLLEQTPGGTIALPKGAINEGYTYNLTAKPGANKIVKQWWVSTDGGTTWTPTGESGNSFSFTADPNAQYKAEFIDNFYPGLVGTYPGLFGNAFIADTTPTHLAAFNLNNGGATFKLTKTGAFTGTVTIGGKSIAVKGTFNGLKVASVTAKDLALELELDDTVSAQAFITGTAVYNGGTPVTLKSYLAQPYTGKTGSIAPLNGKRFNLAIQRGTEDPLLGFGFASVAIGKTGVATLSGQLPDGTAFTASVPVVEKPGDKYVLPFSRQLAKGNTGLLHGELIITDDGDPAIGDTIAVNPATFSYGLGWLRAASVKPADPFSIGILKNLAALGSEWTLTKQTLANINLLTGGANLALFPLTLDKDSQVIPAATYWGYWPSNNKPALNALPKGTTFAFVASTGAFSGKTTKLVSGKTVSIAYTGLVLPDSVEIIPNPALNGVGYLLHNSTPSASGKVLLGETLLTTP